MGAKKVDFDQAGRTPTPNRSIAKRLQQAESANLSQSSPATASQPESNHIYLIGSAMAQSKLLVNHIEKNTGFSCFLVEDFEELGQSIEQYDDSVLLMRDCYRKSNEMILAELQMVFQEEMPGTLLSLLNLKENSGLELKALECGVKGFL